LEECEKVNIIGSVHKGGPGGWGRANLDVTEEIKDVELGEEVADEGGGRELRVVLEIQGVEIFTYVEADSHEDGKEISLEVDCVVETCGHGVTCVNCHAGK
jgi:hypothetical protein